jgi:hypothetical protein
LTSIDTSSMTPVVLSRANKVLTADGQKDDPSWSRKVSTSA